jgi:hypothetical protein
MFALSRRDRRRRLRRVLSEVLFRVRAAELHPGASGLAIADARIQLIRSYFFV